MDIQELWEKALRQTDIIRRRIKELSTFDTTILPYIFLAESSDNPKNTIVRKGHVEIDKPMLILPEYSPQFEGFDFEKNFSLSDQMVINFLLVRGVTFPSLKYHNNVFSLDVHNDSLKDTTAYYLDYLQKQEDINTGLIVGPEDCWQFSVLFFICLTISKSASIDIKRLLEKFKTN